MKIELDIINGIGGQIVSIKSGDFYVCFETRESSEQDALNKALRALDAVYNDNVKHQHRDTLYLKYVNRS